VDGKLQFMLSQRGEISALSLQAAFCALKALFNRLSTFAGKPLLVHDGFSFGIQYVRKDKRYWQCNLSRKYNCKARVTTTDAGDIIVTNNEHCHTEIRQHLRKDYKMNKLHNQLSNQLTSHYMALSNGKMSLPFMTSAASTSSLPTISTTTTSIMPRQIATPINSYPKNLSMRSRSPSPTTPKPQASPPKSSSDDQQQF
jgi:FLYWCH zinc finger domain